MRTSLPLVVLAAVGFGSVASAQCPEQRLSSAVPDFAHFGRDVAVSGSTMIVGSVVADAAFVFEESGGVWQETFRLDNPTPASDSMYGGSVAISGDTALVSDTRQFDLGRIHVFVRSGPGWSLQATLLPSDGAPFDFFGATLAIDGDTIVARKSVGFEWAVHVFDRSGTDWQETEKLVRPGISFFGTGLALEGNTLLVGDYGDPTQGYNAGAAFFYTRVGGVWAEGDAVYPTTSFDDIYFGSDVALEAGTAVVGAPAFFNPQRRGSAYVYEQNGNHWRQTQRLFGLGSPTTSPVGLRVSIEGDRILLGAAGDEPSNVPGATFVFEKSGGEWLQTSKLRRPTGDEDFDLFGYSVEQRGDQVFIGSPGEGSGVEKGHVHVFDMTLAQSSSYCQSTVNSTGLAAEIASVGSHLSDVDDMTLIARDVPNEPGLFLMGQQTTQMPIWDGFLCVAPPVVRMPMETASMNRLVHHVDLSSLPVTVLAGSTWHFQAWFRDPAAGGAGANLSNGVTVPFCP